jgi:hypothetical protein
LFLDLDVDFDGGGEVDTSTSDVEDSNIDTRIVGIIPPLAVVATGIGYAYVVFHISSQSRQKEQALKNPTGPGSYQALRCL